MLNVVLSREEIAARGEEIYERAIRSKVENQFDGSFLVLDIETGEYELDRDDLVATKRMLATNPDAVLYGLRIGHRAAYRVCGLAKARG